VYRACCRRPGRVGEFARHLPGRPQQLCRQRLAHRHRRRGLRLCLRQQPRRPLGRMRLPPRAGDH